MMDLKNIHIGQIIKQRIAENDIDISRICNFMKCSEVEINKMYEEKSLDAEILLKWSKLSEYDFFRIYSQHLILYSPITIGFQENKQNKRYSVPQFRKNIYTRQLIDFILQRIRLGEMTKSEVINVYRIPKTTLYKWISKYEEKR